MRHDALSHLQDQAKLLGLEVEAMLPTLISRDQVESQLFMVGGGVSLVNVGEYPTIDIGYHGISWDIMFDHTGAGCSE